MPRRGSRKSRLKIGRIKGIYPPQARSLIPSNRLDSDAHSSVGAERPGPEGMAWGWRGRLRAVMNRFDCKTMAAAVLGLCALTLKALAADITPEVEPNDLAAVATPLDLSAGSAIGSGALTVNGDVDFFSFVAPAGAKVWILVDTGGTNVPGAAIADPYLTLLSGDGTSEVEADDDDGLGNGGTVAVTNFLASAITGRRLKAGGTYYLRLQRYDAPIASYLLYVNLTTDTSVPESEPNSVVATANPLILSASPLGVRAGRLDSASDQDFYRVETLASNLLFLALDCDPARAGSIYLEMDLIATNGSTVLYATDPPGPARPIRVGAGRAFCYRVPVSGAYYVRVRHGAGGLDAACYELMALSRGSGTFLFGAATYSVREDGGSVAIEVLRAAGSSGTVTVQFATSNATAVAGTDYTAVQQTLTFGDGVTRQWATVPVLDDTVTEANETVALVLKQPTGGAVVGSSAASEFVILDNDEAPNNSPATATPIAFGTGAVVVDQAAPGVPLMMSPEHDEDWFRFTAPAGSVLWALVDTGGTAAPGANSRDSQLALFAADGATLIEEDDDDGNGNGADSILELEGELASGIAGCVLTNSGTYYLRVRAYETNQVIAPYQLYLALTTSFTHEVEPNPLPVVADVLLQSGMSSAVIRGSIATAGDVDYYSITVASNSLVLLAVDGDPERDSELTDLILELYTTNSPAPLFYAEATTIDLEPAQAFAYRFTEAGTYFVRVSHPADGTGTYALLAARADLGPHLQAVVTRPDARLRFDTRIGKHYEIQRTTGMLANPSWESVTTVTGTGQIYEYLDSGGGNLRQQYYRVIERP